MVRVIQTNSDDWNAGDTNTTFQDAVLTAGVRILVGEYDAPQGSKATIGGDKGFLELFDDTTTAVREDGELTFTAVNNSTGVEVEIYTMSTRTAGASGQISVPSEWNFYRTGSKAGDKIRMYFKSNSADTLDSTDHNWIVPVTLV